MSGGMQTMSDSEQRMRPRRDPMRKTKTLLIVAPSLFQCFHTAREHGLTPGEIENFRNVTKAIELRGVTPGTPYITLNRDSWSATQQGFDLDQALGALERLGRVRPARADDIENSRG